MTRWDTRLLSFVVACGLVSLLLAGVAQAGEATAFSVVSPHGTTLHSLDRSCRLSVEGLVGEVVLEVDDGSVSVVRSGCAQQRCVHAAAIGSDGGVIVCVPNGIAVRVSGNEDPTGVDDVVR